MDQDRLDQHEGLRSPACEAEVDQLCDAFERQWQAGERPVIESYLERADSRLRAELLRELVALEVAYRHRAGEEVSLAEYQQRFPEHAGPLQDAWQLLTSWRERDTLAPRAGSPSGNTDAILQSEPDTVGKAVSQTTPSQFGRYQIQAELGSGAFGTVYRALDPQLQRCVAIKVPHRSWIGAAAAVRNVPARSPFRGPAQASRSGGGVRRAAGRGQRVHRAGVRRRPGSRRLGGSRESDPARIVRLMIEIVEAVGFAHQHDLVHRDLKPANILVDQQGHPHVADFGLALNESLQQLKRGETCGTPAYMSPEQVRGETHRLGRALGSVEPRRDPVRTALPAGVRLWPMAATPLFDEIKHRDPKPLAA